VPGGVTWVIPALWKVGDAGEPHTNSFKWSDQSFTIDGDGTMTVSKFGCTTKRTIHNFITVTTDH
jgi:hypothetical protein